MILRLSGRRYDHIRRYLFTSGILENSYRVLGLQAGASKKEVKSAYRDMVKTCHPDLFPDDKSKESEFRRIQEAYENILSGNITGSDDSGPSPSQRTGRSGFGQGNSDWGPNVGFDFEQNYRARMKARAEWEKMAKKYKDAEREKYQKANRHYADWDNGGNDDDTKWYKDQSEHFRTGPRHRSSYSHEFRSEADERRYQQARAQRVQDNLHKSDKYQKHFDEEEINRMNKAAFQRRQKYYEAATRKESEDNAWRTESQNKVMLRIISQVISIGIIYSLYILYREQKEAREIELTRKQLYNNESAYRFNQMVQERLAQNSARATNSQSNDDSNLSENDRRILDTLEHNSAVLKSRGSGNGGPLN